MLPQFGITEFLLLAVVALIVVGPKDLPRMMHAIGQFAGKARRMAGEFRASFDEIAKQAQMEELRDEIETLKRENAVSKAVEELKDVEGAINEAILNKPPSDQTNAAQTNEFDTKSQTPPIKPAKQVERAKDNGQVKNSSKKQIRKTSKSKKQTTSEQTSHSKPKKPRSKQTSNVVAKEKTSDKRKFSKTAKTKEEFTARKRPKKNLAPKTQKNNSRVKSRNQQRKSTTGESVSRNTN